MVEHLRAECDAAVRAHKATRAGATHEEAKPENDKDTRALEQSYVERGQAKRVLDLEIALADTEKMPLRAFGEEDPIALGALVFVMEGDAVRAFFIAPAGGGHRVGDVQIVTPPSPIGRALLGKKTGDEPEVVVAGKKRTFEIVRVD
ncbi:MAG TPA: GreA/GreB family elongation factor [Polyangiaceae bacterium]